MVRFLLFRCFSSIKKVDESKIVCSLTNVTKKLQDGTLLFRDVSLGFVNGAKIGVIGINGAGKSSLMKIMAGMDKLFEGEVKVGAGIKMGYLAQEPNLDPKMKVKETVYLGISEKVAILDEYDEVTEELGNVKDEDEMEELLSKQAELQNKIENDGLWDLPRRVHLAMEALRCPPSDALVSTLSGGERRRVALCQLLLSEPNVLLLDEPTNHLDAESVTWLEKFLGGYKGTVCAITHDRYFLDNVAKWILEVDNGACIPFVGNYSSWLASKQNRNEQSSKKAESRNKVIQRELEWMRNNSKSLTKARLSKFEDMVEEKDLIEKAKVSGKLLIPPGPRLGKKVIELVNVTKKVGNRLLLENVSFFIPCGAIVGVIGPNGIGKTTLFKIITGQEKLDSGYISVGDTVKFGYVQQTRDSLDPNKSIYEEIAQGAEYIAVGTEQYLSRAYIAQFNFKSNDQNKKMCMLSGGERNRVHLAKMLRNGCNVLLLDEPTNDLDVDTLRTLEDSLPDFPGCAIVISHDRWFLDRICTHILSFEGNGKTVFFEGNYSQYEVDRKTRLGTKSSRVGMVCKTGNILNL